MLYQAARSRGPDNSGFPISMLAAQARIFAPEAAIKIALQIFGACGYSRELLLERLPQTRDGYLPKVSMRNAAE